jgi:hypothetical protein
MLELSHKMVITTAHAPIVGLAWYARINESANNISSIPALCNY